MKRVLCHQLAASVVIREKVLSPPQMTTETVSQNVRKKVSDSKLHCSKARQTRFVVVPSATYSICMRVDSHYSLFKYYIHLANLQHYVQWACHCLEGNNDNWQVSEDVSADVKNNKFSLPGHNYRPCA